MRFIPEIEMLVSQVTEEYLKLSMIDTDYLSFNFFEKSDRDLYNSEETTLADDVIPKSHCLFQRKFI